MNIYLKSARSVGKIVVLVILAYLTLNMFFVKGKTQLIISLFILIFITLPTIFIFFYKKKYIEKHPGFAKAWKVLRVFYAIIVVLYVAAWCAGTWHLSKLANTQKTIDFINSKKITLDDVMGKNLPAVPDQKINDSTIAGIDANKNYIRDDVELAIFQKYPNSAKIRAAELQYAQAMQLELTQVSDSKTLVPVMQKEDLAFDCLGFSGPDTSLSAANKREEEIKGLVLDISPRIEKDKFVFEKYMIGYASSLDDECNINISSLPN